MSASDKAASDVIIGKWRATKQLLEPNLKKQKQKGKNEANPRLEHFNDQ